MGLLERFTRDDVSKYVWGSVLLASILSLIVAFSWGGNAVRDARLDAQQRAVAAVEDVLEPRLGAAALASPITGQAEASLQAAAARSILDDPRIARVRIWSADGLLLFSTDPKDEPGSSEALNDEVLADAAAGRTITRWNLSDTGGIDEVGRSLVRTYTPIRSVVAEVDHTEAGTIAPVRTTWLGYQIAAAIAAAICLGLTILSLRDPLERINAGVPFAPSSVPAGYSLIDDERLHAVEEVYRLAHERVARLEAKLVESEAIRRQLEGDIQRVLTSAATGAVTQPITAVAPSSPAAATRAPAPPAQAPPPAPAPAEPKRRRRQAERPAAAREPAGTPKPAARRTPAPRTPAPSTPAPARTPEVARRPEIVQVPDSELLGDSWAAAAPAGPLARAMRDDRPAPVGGPSAAPSAEPASPKRMPKLRRRSEPGATVTVPEPEIDDSAAHAAALETFIRLTESDRQHQETGEVDQGAVRAALARTAARKKPGGTRLQAHEEPAQEVQGGGPMRDER